MAIMSSGQKIAGVITGVHRLLLSLVTTATRAWLYAPPPSVNSTSATSFGETAPATLFDRLHLTYAITLLVYAVRILRENILTRRQHMIVVIGGDRGDGVGRMALSFTGMLFTSVIRYQLMALPRCRHGWER